MQTFKSDPIHAIQLAAERNVCKVCNFKVNRIQNLVRLAEIINENKRPNQIL